MTNENININIFDNWALNDKDIGMEKGHTDSVNKMINIIKERTTILDNKFNFLDLGCGNGWVVEKFLNNKLCNLSVGVDGSYNMIKKARDRVPKGIFFQSKIDRWNNDNKFDIIFSMETFYYFENLNLVFKKVYDLLKKNAIFIFGIDHYLENKPSLTWERDIGIKTQTISIDGWVEKIKQHKFNDVQYLQYGKREKWGGTLIISGIK